MYRSMNIKPLILAVLALVFSTSVNAIYVPENPLYHQAVYAGSAGDLVHQYEPGTPLEDSKSFSQPTYFPSPYVPGEPASPPIVKYFTGTVSSSASSLPDSRTVLANSQATVSGGTIDLAENNHLFSNFGVEAVAAAEMSWSLGINDINSSMLGVVDYVPVILESFGTVEASASGLGSSYASIEARLLEGQNAGTTDLVPPVTVEVNEGEHDELDMSWTIFVDLNNTDLDLPVIDIYIKAFTQVNAGAYWYDSATFDLTYPHIEAGTFGTGSATAILDPVAYIDPTWEYADQFEVIVSPAINNTVVPVPAAVWLFSSGLIGLVGVARRKKV